MTHPTRRSAVRALGLGALASLPGCSGRGLTATDARVPEVGIRAISVQNIDTEPHTVNVTISEGGRELYRDSVTIEGDEDDAMPPQRGHTFGGHPTDPGVYMVELEVEEVERDVLDWRELLEDVEGEHPSSFFIEGVVMSEILRTYVHDGSKWQGGSPSPSDTG